MGRRRFVVQIDSEKCTKCGECTKKCSKINHPRLCSGCGKCIKVCPSEAITLAERTDNNKTYTTMIAKGFGFTLLFLAAIAGFSVVTMFLWNALLPDIFGIACINFWQTLGLLALSRILFGGMGAGVMGLHHHHHNSIHKKWAKMSNEQRREFIKKRINLGFGNHCDKGHPDMDDNED